ncbi:hypothetical protein L0Y65_06825 [Candidatus Micrarchaeota archaeon]|nr:hypothetical protein [Candidatus Micrarchaeota archaeon]
MAQRQVKPPERTDSERLLEQMRELVDYARNLRVPLTPPQREQMRQFLDQMNQLMQQVQTTQPGGQSQVPPQSRTVPASRRVKQFGHEDLERELRLPVTPQAGEAEARHSPQSRTVPAPRRVEQFVYDVSLGGRTYRVALADPLPALRGGGVDLATAQRRLHDLLLNNQLVRRENPNDPMSPVIALAQVNMPGTTPADQRFNAGAPNQRLDMFRDAYLGLTFRGGNYAESSAILIAEAPRANETRRN